MEQTKFLASFKDQFDFFDEEPVITLATVFKDMDDWDSLVALSVIAMADTDYGVSISGDDIRNSDTVEDLMNLIEKKSNA